MSSRSAGASASADSSSAIASRKTTKTYTYKQDGSGNISSEVHTKVEGSDMSSQAIRRMEERIRVIMDDLESEQHLRKRIEREKQDLQIQIIHLSERLTEAEGGAESQLDINRKREAEMAKLRKLLEDVHNESEQTIHILRKKHQEAMMELQEQIQSVARSKELTVKEKSKLQVEIQELYAKIEVLQSEKISMKKVVEKLEIQVHEYNIKMEDLNRSVMDMNSGKSRLAMENQENVRMLNEYKHAIEAAGLDKNRIGNQLKDLQSNLDNVSRQKSQAESRVVSIEQHMKSINIELQEHKEMRMELERQLIKWKDECMDWKKRYENEARLRIEDVDTLKKKFGVQIADLQDQLDAVLRKMKELEQQKNKLTQEVQIMVSELQVSQTTIKELTMRLKSSEARADDLAAKLREMTNLYEQTDRENKARAQEIVRLGNDLDRAKMDNEGLRANNGKLSDENRSYKAELDALKKRYHELDMENKKLAHDREELARAYKDADGRRNKAEGRVQDLENELKRLRNDAEKTIRAKDEEINEIKRKLMMQIDSLTQRLHETESKLKNEVETMKKKMAMTITELEMSLDAANKSNASLQNTVNVQQVKITELTQVYEDTRNKLQTSIEQYQTVIQKIQIYEQEINTLKTNLGQALNDRKVSDSRVNELSVKITEITNVNNQLTDIKMKLEKELSTVSADYNDVARELKLADDRANKAGHDAQHFEVLLREESNKLVKIDQAKKALETELRSVTIRMEEIESTAMSSSRVTIKKMEQRIEELEVMYNREKQMHIEATTMLHKSERSIKELLLQSEEDRKNIIILQESLDKLNEKIKMYKRQLEEQESISNSNIMRVKKFQRELESAENRAVDAESTLNAFRSRQRVFATAESRRAEEARDSVEREVIIKKTITNVNVSNVSDSSMAANAGSFATNAGSYAAERGFRAGSSARLALQNADAAASSSSAMSSSAYRSGGMSSSSSAMRAAESSSGYRAGSTYSRAGSMARSSMARATSMGRSGSVLRY